MKTKSLIITISILSIVIIVLVLINLEMREDINELNKVIDLVSQESVSDKREFYTYKVVTVAKQEGSIIIDKNESYEGMVFFTVSNTEDDKPIVIIGDSSNYNGLQGRLDTFPTFKDGSCIIKRSYDSSGEKRIYGKYVIYINGNKKIIDFQFGPFNVK